MHVVGLEHRRGDCAAQKECAGWLGKPCGLLNLSGDVFEIGIARTYMPLESSNAYISGSSVQSFDAFDRFLKYSVLIVNRIHS